MDEKSYTIGRLGELCGLSRSTLIYYDSIGLLIPSARSTSGYRLYTEVDRTRLDKILVFRSLGFSLERIGELLKLEDASPTGALLRRVFEINEEISSLRAQQKATLDLLESDGSLKVGKAALLALSELGRAIGITEANYESLHAAFQANAPGEHRRLLGLLGFSSPEVEEFLSSLKKNP